MKINNTAYLCGHFFVDAKKQSALSVPSTWTALTCSDETRNLLSNFYYTEFVEFCTQSRKKYIRTIDCMVTVPLQRSGTACTAKVTEIQWSLYPYGIVMFAIGVEFRQTPEEQVCEALARLRDCCWYTPESTGEFLDVAIRPLKELYQALGGKHSIHESAASYLTETGNKLKLFQIVEGKDMPKDSVALNKILFGMGCLYPYQEDDIHSISKDYYEAQISKHTLSVYGNWKALMLFDTVTFVAVELSDFQRKIWQNDYFGMIYQYELYRKVYLYRLNRNFRQSRAMAETYQAEFNDFNRLYSFQTISYNFLPNDVDKIIWEGLEVGQEQQQIEQAIEMEVKDREEKNDKHMNMFLLFLTIMASFSSVWDISCMLDMVINFGEVLPAAYIGYRISVSIVLTIIFATALILNMHKKK